MKTSMKVRIVAFLTLSLGRSLDALIRHDRADGRPFRRRTGDAMRRGTVALIVAVALGLLAVGPTAEAQPASKVPRIGFLGSGSPASGARVIEAFRQGLRELGYVEGQKIAIEWRFAGGRYERFPELASELVGLKVDVIVAAPAAAVAAKEAIRTIPLVVVVASDPVGSGLVASLSRPGGNVTGLSLLSTELTAKQLQLLKEALPRVSRVAILRNPATQHHLAAVEEAKRAARLLGLQLQVVEARNPQDFDRAFSMITRERAGALLVPADGMFFLHRARLAELAARSRLPSMGGIREYTEAGGLMAYAANLSEAYRSAAVYVDKILKGAKPGDLPVEQPTKFELVINLKTAKALGLTIPRSLLLRADEIIQ